MMKKYIVNKEKSLYKILLPHNASEVLKFAGDELVYFISRAAGAILEIETVFDERQAYISLGGTPLFERFGSSLKDCGTNTSAYSVKTAEGHILIAGKTDHGTLYGVYGFLSKVFGVEIYSGDTFRIPQRDNVLYKELDFCDSPDIEYRHVGFYNAIKNPVSANRLRVLSGDMTMRAHAGQKTETAGDVVGSDVMEGIWGGLWAHTVLSKILPPEKDQDGEILHRDWYNEQLNQLCPTNPQARKQFIKNLKEIILQHPNSPLFMLGAMDNNDFCRCERCLESDLKYGGPSGTHLRFLNIIAKEIGDWQKSVLPGKNFKLVAFAYNAFNKRAPVVCDESLIIPDNAAIMIAPMDACFRHAITAPCNEGAYGRIKAWAAFSKHLLIWDYHAYFDNSLIYAPGIKTFKENVAFYKEIGVFYYFNEGPQVDKTAGFHDLKVYLYSKLMWDSGADAEQLIADFMKNYYKSAAGHMRRYYNKLENNLKRLEKLYASLGERGYHTAVYTLWQPDVMTERHWPKEFLLSSELLLEDALSKITEEDEEERRKIEIRIKTELLSIKFLLIEIGSYFCSEDEFNQRILEFKEMVKECGIERLTASFSNASSERLETRINSWYNRYPNRVKHNR